ncbi:MAG TPA: PEGA domain-containing protein [Polyangiaceae bacterium LLY-WYZ-15_(1-7)]|nr:hypothetical protein [Myxococcales bacterium]MAT27746.1 hypothetical protein [Sandaracinus sp.]HJK90825.1 PEGA domain-containing protein [Polyangiaceae bacterium LLY-WYZ-15_(1-7)]MBJ71447.1 hypothetical protein [Sandaracinus sp.]HJL02062.1 PEGA domain-containing protein [Polyangiaceae bacterium LLY-WYZ-15_(1-7)]
MRLPPSIPLALLLVASSLGAARAQTEAQRAEARRHFQQGIEAFERSDFEGARIEFEAAYALVPNYQLLYNIGNVHAALGNAVEAEAAYQDYLARGGAEIDAERRAAVEAALAAQRAQIGTLQVRSNLEGATVTVDGEPTDHVTPLSAPIRLARGAYTIGLDLTGYDGPTRRVTIAGGSAHAVEIELTPLVEARAQLAIRSSVPDVEVSVDGEVVGTTPLRRVIVVPPGTHEVMGRRAGYRPAQTRVSLEEGGEAEARLRMEWDPDALPEALGQLAVRIPEGEARIFVDGESVSRERLPARVPRGRHRVRVRLEERQEFVQDIDLGAEPLELRPELQWTDAALRQRVDRAGNLRLLSIVSLASGLAIGVASTGLFVWNRNERADADALIALFEGPDGCITLGRDCAAEHGDEVERRYEAARNEDGVRTAWLVGSTIGMTLGGLLAVAGLTGIVLVPSDEEIAASASARLRLGPGTLSLEASF